MNAAVLGLSLLVAAAGDVPTPVAPDEGAPDDAIDDAIDAPLDEAPKDAHEAELQGSIDGAFGLPKDRPFVLALGVNEGEAAGLRPLLFADDDAAEVIRLFGGGDRTRLLTVMDATTQRRYPDLAAAASVPSRQALEQAVTDLRRGVDRELARGEKPIVVVWISGHADYDAQGHPYLPLAGGQLQADELIDTVVRPLATAHRVHLVIDTCFASALVKSRAVVEEASATEAKRAFLERRIGGLANVGLLAGSTATNRAYEWEEIGGGVFSAMVRAGLRGAADVDGDDAVSYPELSAFLAAAARDVAAEEARPKVRVVAPAIEGDAALVRRDWLDRVAVLEADLAPLGTVHILDDTGAWLLAGAFEAGHQPRLWLPRGRRLFLRSGEVDHQLVEGSSGFSLGPASQRASRARSLIGTALREGLFKRPFGPAFFGGYTAFAQVSPGGPDPDPGEGGPPKVDVTEAVDEQGVSAEGLTNIAAEADDGISWVTIATLSGAAAVGGVMAASGAFFVMSVTRFAATPLERQAAWELNNALLFGAISAGALVATGALLGGGAVLLVVE
jgi:hypothetical protein